MWDLEDTQSEPDVRNIPIQRVGVRGIRHPFRLADADGGEQFTVGRASLSVYLPAHVRGTHMSRFVAFLQSGAERIGTGSIGKMPGEVASLLGAEEATVEFDFPFFIVKKAPVTGVAGRVDYEASLRGHWVRGETRSEAVVRVPVTTLCPCSRNISERGAHNQRGLVCVAVEAEVLPRLEDLVRLVEGAASAELYSVLKRPDEKHVTERAYDNPVFVEDLVRNLAQELQVAPGIRRYRIEAENFESIHNHSAFAVVEG